MYRLLCQVWLIIQLTPTESLPNIILILTDDQDNLKGMHPLNNTVRLLGNPGITFPNAFVTTPLCCPSRSSILTGLYQHNHKTYNNTHVGGCYSASWRENMETRAFVTFLKASHYRTFFAGKYLNQYGKDHTLPNTAQVPFGWDWWAGLQGNSVYHNYNLSINGTWTHFGRSQASYLTTVIKELSLKFLRTRSESPFFMMISVPAPHSPRTPENKYRNHFEGELAKRDLRFNKPVSKDKHWLMRQSPTPLYNDQVEMVDEIYRDRLRTLLSVDDLVTDVFQEMEHQNLTDNTFVIFTSDNGYHLGQFSMPEDKRLPYESDIRVPLMIRGPGIERNITDPSIILNIDLAPTILKLAGLDPPSWMDGQPFLRQIDNKTVLAGPNRERFLIQYYGEAQPHQVLECQDKGAGMSNCDPMFDCKCQDTSNNTYSCLRELSLKKNTLFCHFQDDENYIEFYNLTNDPLQLDNISNQKALQHREGNLFFLNMYRSCSGFSCHHFEM